MKSFHGIAVSTGIAIAKALVFREDSLPVPRYEITASESDAHFGRFQQATVRASEDLRALRDATSRTERDRALLDSHLLMLSDVELHDRIRKDLDTKLLNVEWLLAQYAQELAERMGAMEDEYIRERAADFHDAMARVLDHLLHRERISLADIDDEVVLVGHNLLPSDAVMLNPRKVRGVALDLGGKTSHTAIIARSFGIPAVTGLREASRAVETGSLVIVDGHTGVVVAEPDEVTLTRYEADRGRWLRREAELDDLSTLPARTRDGHELRLDANIEVPGELEAVISHGAQGIGLFRSEFLYLSSKGEPTELEQAAVYTEVVARMSGKPVTIRTFDLGGDKNIPGLTMREEENPILGWRAIRYCLANPRLFKTQLRALLRASTAGDLRIMFPMVSGLEELDRARSLLAECRDELAHEGVGVADHVPVGVMIEIPSAAMIADVLAREVEFFSIGSNDLIQYTVAVDRSNERIAYLYEPLHLGVLRLLKLVVDHAHAAGIPVGVCGEIAGDPAIALVLLGLGMDELSMGPFSIPAVKRVVRGVEHAEAVSIVRELLDPATHRGAVSGLARFLEDRFGADDAR